MTYVLLARLVSPRAPRRRATGWGGLPRGRPAGARLRQPRRHQRLRVWAGAGRPGHARGHRQGLRPGLLLPGLVRRVVRAGPSPSARRPSSGTCSPSGWASGREGRRHQRGRLPGAGSLGGARRPSWSGRAVLLLTRYVSVALDRRRARAPARSWRSRPTAAGRGSSASRSALALVVVSGPTAPTSAASLRGRRTASARPERRGAAPRERDRSARPWWGRGAGARRWRRSCAKRATRSCSGPSRRTWPRRSTSDHANPYLPACPPAERLRATHDLGGAVRGAGLVVSVSPSQFVGRVMAGPRPTSRRRPGGERVEGHRDRDAAPHGRGARRGPSRAGLMARFCVLSGPSFAAEVAREAPTAVVVATRDAEAARARPGALPDRATSASTRTGRGRGGAGRGPEERDGAGGGRDRRARASATTPWPRSSRGGWRRSRASGSPWARRGATFSGLAGMGDLVLTCTGSLSRNRTVGYRLGRGERSPGSSPT